MKMIAETAEHDGQHGMLFELRSEREMNEQELCKYLKVISSLTKIHKNFKAYLILMLLSAKFSSAY